MRLIHPQPHSSLFHSIRLFTSDTFSEPVQFTPYTYHHRGEGRTLDNSPRCTRRGLSSASDTSLHFIWSKCLKTWRFNVANKIIVSFQNCLHELTSLRCTAKLGINQ